MMRQPACHLHSTTAHSHRMHVNAAPQQPHWRSHEALVKQQIKGRGSIFCGALFHLRVGRAA
jgi:hypothetical protein